MELGSNMNLDFQSIPRDELMSKLRTLGQAMMDFKIIASMVLVVFTIYMIGIETAWGPTWKDIERREEAKQRQEEQLRFRQQEQAKQAQWDRQLSSLHTAMVQLKPNESAPSAALEKAETVKLLALGGEKSMLEPPHGTRQVLSNKLTGNTTVNLKVEANPLSVPGGRGPEAEMMGRMSAGGAAQEQQIQLQRYDYVIEVVGTYPGLMDFMNQLVQLKELVAVDEVTLTYAGSPQQRPDPETEPDYPTKVKMNLKYSIYLYEQQG